MFLKRLELVGFKSFATRTPVEFAPGIVVVVGPNGSGKSNISDSVLWVLGEQSARAVRARKPEEVIFAGSASRQPLGMAEASLVLDNSDDSLPIEFAEVRVTRRLYRSGDSEYLLNGAKVRLRDITQLLLHAGLSPDSYTVISQGSIDELILQRADERRVVFENAADIRRHQLRLNDTRSKLATTEANLVRVQDVLAELTPHVRRLKAQADRAARVEAVRTELHGLLLKTFQVRLSRAHVERRRAEDDLRQATEASNAAEAESRSAEQQLKGLDERLLGMDDRLGGLRPRAEALREQLRATERGLAVGRERRTGLTQQQAGIKVEVERLQGELERLSLDEAEAARNAGLGDDGVPQTEADEIAAARAALATAVTANEAAQAQRAAAQTAVAQSERRISDAESRLQRTQQHLQSLEANVTIDRARQTDREARATTLSAQLATVERERANGQEQLTAARNRLAATSSTRGERTRQLEQAREALREVSQQADRLQGALAALGAVDLSRRDDADLPAEWQTILHDLPVLGHARELAGRIRPIDLLLRGYLQRIVVLDSDAAAREAHQRLTARLPAETAAWAVLSMNGLLLTSNGERPLEPVGDESPSVLADWSRQVRELEEQRNTAETRRRTVLNEVQSARDALDDAEADERTARRFVADEEARLAELARAENTARTELQQVRTEQDRAARLATQRSDESARASRTAQSIRDELSGLRTDQQRLIETLRAADEALAAHAEAVNEARSAVAVVEAARGRREAERRAREALHARVKAEIESNSLSRIAASARLEQLDGQLVELGIQEASLTGEAASLTAQLEPIDAELLSAEQGRADLLQERHALEQRLAVTRAAERTAHEAREARHVMAQRATDEVDRLRTEIAETAELEAELSGGADWAEQLRMHFEDVAGPEAQEVFDLDAARRRIGTLQRELRAVGGVADSVVDEYREMSDRHEFLEHQSADLRAAMAELQTAAAELEAHMRERFAEVFSATQTAFQECFTELFGGGEARLVLTNPDDVLQSGIEIVARPPGKKLQGLLSLSGGERALTIVSLLFGLLKINPTPFCVLDEVDAALDEANVQRFANLLAEFARRIQFIVVTHNRATMDKADAMYGVSMDAQGISHVFSIRPAQVADAAREPVSAMVE